MAIINLGSAAQFDQVTSEGVVLVDFFAEWCGPCKMIAPFLKKIADEKGYTIVKVDVDQVPEPAQRFNVTSIPTLVMFKDGKAVETKMGFMAEPQLLSWFNQYL